MMPLILIQGDDVKTRMWRAEALRLGVEVAGIPGSPMKIPVYLARTLLRRGRPVAIVYRYLNDYPSLVRTLMRTLAEIIGLFACVLLSIRVVWICHNVDRESLSYFPRLSAFRRAMFTRWAKMVLVTDEHLLKYARRYLPEARAKLGTVTFGPYTRRVSDLSSRELNEAIKAFVHRSKSDSDGANGTLIGLCAGAATWKMAHYERIPRLLEEARQAGYSLYVIVVGPIGPFFGARNPAILRFLEEDHRVFFHDGYVALDEVELAQHIDFYWRAYLDLSVAFSLYVAASVGKPILAQGPGFVAEAVSRYRLGAVVQDDFTNISSALQAVRHWNPEATRKFFEDHNWMAGAKSLIEACGVPLSTSESNLNGKSSVPIATE